MTFINFDKSVNELDALQLDKYSMYFRRHIKSIDIYIFMFCHGLSPCIDNAGYQCDRCGKMFAYEYYRDKHLKYTRCVDQGDRKYPCHLCTR